MIDILEIFSNAGYRGNGLSDKESGRKLKKYVYENAEEFDLVVCAGGDGTLDNTVGGIMRLERKLQEAYSYGIYSVWEYK